MGFINGTHVLSGSTYEQYDNIAGLHIGQSMSHFVPATGSTAWTTGSSAVTHTGSYSVSKVVTITTENGYTIKCGEDTPFLTKDESQFTHPDSGSCSTGVGIDTFWATPAGGQPNIADALSGRILSGSTSTRPYSDCYLLQMPRKNWVKITAISSSAESASLFSYKTDSSTTNLVDGFVAHSSIEW